MKKEEKNTKKISRRAFFRYTASIGAVVGMSTILPAYAFAGFGERDVLEPKGADNILDLTISEIPINIDGKTSTAIGINGSVPGPLIRLKEGEDVLLRVKNELKEDTSIHWHGIILPFQMDGVPGVSFDGIKPGETFEYRFPVTQNGTYWYHSHSKLQEQLGHYGPMIIEPKDNDPVEYDREYPVLLSDWTFESPYDVMNNMKKMDGYYNYQKRTFGEFFKDVSEDGFVSAFKNYTSFARMRMSPTDLADVTGATYTYLMNGRGPESNWNALFKKGERIRLRFINGSAGSTFDVRIPGLKMTVVQADGQNIEPVSIEEFRIGIAETYDVIVEPKEEKAFTIFAESLDRSGFARGTLAPNEGMAAAVPVLRPRPTRTMKDMGMNMSDMKMDGMKMDNMEKKDNAMEGMDNGNMDHNMMGMSGMNSDPVKHGPDRHGVGAAAIADNQYNRLNEPGIGLGKDGRKVLVYNDLKSLEPNIDERKPEREVELHLTGNMERYMWSFDGKEFNEVKGPIEFTQDERLRLILVNDTMMEHPIHLHGMWMELENENGIYNPRKHTLLIQPAQRISALVTPRDKGRWAFHCHILYHMEMGMFRVVQVSDKNGGIY
ncbi:MAG: copper resistance system multicopper oxidase [Balneola sp.]|jgi:CopA family copper-resistance protein|nr:copper resistance protein CopA [Balneola sp.]MAO78855.1 copper resistance protein CopA [Balneola sp.]MBF63514.1 copper resistance protein CopA [Balneola sp.]MBR9917709.1 copper resistance system multicopper oxidase [bacterium]|tara:strand:+ start:3252 stop:5066 length:1815 start_codon:yes stop_codon:yes gene_type:complete